MSPALLHELLVAASNQPALALYGDVMVARRNAASARDYYTRSLAGSGAFPDRARVEAALAAMR